MLQTTLVDIDDLRVVRSISETVTPITYHTFIFRIAIPSCIPSISEDNCHVPLPSVNLIDDINAAVSGEEVIAPIQYHKVMAQIAITFHRFSRRLRSRNLPAEQVVQDADAELANLIDTMPSHLQPDGVHDTQRDEMYPWIAWQRWDLSLVFLYHRLYINRTLQKHWLATPQTLSGPRSICLSSASGIVWVTQQSLQPIEKRRQWQAMRIQKNEVFLANKNDRALSVHVVAAAVCLIYESKGQEPQVDDCREQIKCCIEYLEAVKSWNKVATKGLAIINTLLDS